MDEVTGAAGPRSGPPGDLASFGQRLVAVLIDSLIVGIPLAILTQAIFGTNPGGQGLTSLVGLLYFVFLEGSASGQTIGKRVMNIRVVDFANPGPIGYGRAFLRYIGRVISSIACLLGYFWMLWDANKQTWHDKIATTHVVSTASYPVEKWPG